MGHWRPRKLGRFGTVKHTVLRERARWQTDDECVSKPWQRTANVLGQLSSHRIRYAVKSMRHVRPDDDASCHVEHALPISCRGQALSTRPPSSGSLALMSGHDGASEPNGNGIEWLGEAFVPTADTFTAPVDGWHSFGGRRPVFLSAGASVSVNDAQTIAIPVRVEVESA